MNDAQPSPYATLLVSCPDRKGLVAGLAQLLYGHGVNILDSDQHTDLVAGQFFQRIRIDLTELRTDRVTLERGLTEVAERFAMRLRIAYAHRKQRLALMVSRYDHCMHDLLLRRRAGELECDVPVVVSNHPDLAEIAHGYGVAFHHVPITPETKAAQEERLAELFERERIDVIVLARYMQVLSPAFCQRYPERIINIHHSFLPAFIGSRPYHQAYERGVKIIGATAHYVTSDLDQGPIIAQDVAHVSHRDTVDHMVRKGRDLERLVLSQAVRLQLEDRILVYGNKTVVFD